MHNTKEHLNTLIEELIALGEDKDGLSMWNDLFDLLEESEQKELLKNLEEEKEALSKLASNEN